MKYSKLSLLTLLSMIMILGSCLSMSMGNQSSGEERALTAAVLYRNAASVESQLKNGASPNSRSVSGATALITAINNNDLAMAELLLSYGADINMTDKNGATALFYAKKPDIQQWLIKKGIDIRILSKRNKQTAFENYCSSFANIVPETQKNEIMKIIKQQGLPVTRANFEKNEWVNKWDIIRTINIFKNAGYDINSTTSASKTTPLIIAAQMDNYILLQELLTAGANPRLKNGVGDAPLNIISKNPITTQTMTGNSVVTHSYAEYSAIVYSLLAYGADINGTDGDGNTPLCNAAATNYPARVSVLLAMKNCKVDGRGQYGESPMFKTNNYTIVQTLVAYGANVNFLSTWEFTPIFNQTNIYIVQYLVNLGANVNHINKDGDSTLSLDMYKAYDSFKRSGNSATEIENHYIGKVQILIKSGADVNHVGSHNGRSPLSFAKSIPLPRITALLVRAGAR